MRMPTADDVAALIPRDAFIVCGGLPGAPLEILRAMCRRLPELGRPTLYCGDIAGQFSFLDDIPPSAFGQLHLLIGGGPVPRTDRAHVDLSPYSVYETERLFASGRWKTDVCLITARPPNVKGAFVLSPQVACLKTASRSSLILAEIDPGLPLLHGDSEIAGADVAAYVEIPQKLTWVDAEIPNAVIDGIGKKVASIIPNGACIQIGIGTLADATLNALGSHRDLGVHSGFIGDGVRRLMEKGAVNGSCYPLNPGRVVTGALLGGKALHDFANDNSRIAVHPFSLVNNPETIKRIPDFFAINFAVAIDLFGQVNAEGIGGKVRSGGGGQMDFMPAAHASESGTAIIALQSTASHGKVSRIVPPLACGGPITTHRNCVDIVVTERGIADLRGASLRERARRLIDIADPNFQAELEISAERIFG